jgi:spore maturation protein CgeB
MKVLYVGLLYNYGKQEEGYSYEHNNIEAGFRHCKERKMFDVDFMYPDVSSDETYRLKDYDAIFHVAFNESLDFPEIMARAALAADVPVIQWDCDASWRFDSWIKPRANRVSHFVTTHAATIPWYQDNGLKVIKSQWGGSPLYIGPSGEKKYDVTFIGQKHGQLANGQFVRANIIDALMKAGIKVDLFGNYWDGYSNWHGYLRNFDDMLDVFKASKICLNLSNPWHVNTMPQIKGRHFEIPQAGGFQICTPADDLENYFVPGEEIVIAHSIDELVSKIRTYLENDYERDEIALAGYERMLKDHQWHHRFQDIFEQVGIL